MRSELPMRSDGPVWHWQRCTVPTRAGRDPREGVCSLLRTAEQGEMVTPVVSLSLHEKVAKKYLAVDVGEYGLLRFRV